MKTCLSKVPGYQPNIKNVPMQGDIDKALSEENVNSKRFKTVDDKKFNPEFKDLKEETEEEMFKITRGMGLRKIRGIVIATDAKIKANEGTVKEEDEGKMVVHNVGGMMGPEGFMYLSPKYVNTHYDDYGWSKKNHFRKNKLSYIEEYKANPGLIKPQYPLVSSLYSTKELQLKSLMFHELGHHIINKKEGLKSFLEKNFKNLGDRKHNSTHSKKDYNEWFAENFSYWAISRYYNEAPLGRPKDVIDPNFMMILNKLLNKKRIN